MRAGQAHAIGVRLDLRAGDDEQRYGGTPAVEQAGDLRHLDQAELRRREHHQIDGLDRLRIALLEGPNVGFANLVAAHRASRRSTTSSIRCASGVMPAM